MGGRELSTIKAMNCIHNLRLMIMLIVHDIQWLFSYLYLMKNKPITVALFANAYDNELKTNPHSNLKEGTYSVDKNRISFLTKKGEALVINLNIGHIDSIATFNQSVIQLKDNDSSEVRKQIYIFAKSSKNTEYWIALAELIE